VNAWNAPIMSGNSDQTSKDVIESYTKIAMFQLMTTRSAINAKTTSLGMALLALLVILPNVSNVTISKESILIKLQTAQSANLNLCLSKNSLPMIQSDKFVSGLSLSSTASFQT